MTEDRRENKWRIDKHINISVLVVVMVQFTGFIYWVSTIDHLTKSHDTRITNLERWQKERIRDNTQLMQRITRTESKIDGVGENVKRLQSQNNRIENKIDRALEKIR